MNWPYLTDEKLSIGGVIKDRYDDFVVEEIPLYQPCGRGEHLYIRVEKRGLSTDQLIRRLSQALDLSPRNIGYAGKKDRRAVSRQWLSLGQADAERVSSLHISGVNILEIGRHGNKLRQGHLRGNRFEITIREVNPGAEKLAAKLLKILAKKGLPNYFGPQRFGFYGTNAVVGQGILVADARLAFDAMLLGPSSVDNPDRAPDPARTAYKQGLFQEALEKWPKDDSTGQTALRCLARNEGDLAAALAAFPGFMKRFFLNALQSFWFNQCLAGRMPNIDRICNGDLAYLHRNGAVFSVVDEAAEKHRTLDFEISPSGPIWGDRMTLAQRGVLTEETQVLMRTGLTPDEFKSLARRHKLRGQRRVYRVQLKTVELQSGPDGLSLIFELPAGSYGTAVLRELMKENLNEPRVFAPYRTDRTES